MFSSLYAEKCDAFNMPPKIFLKLLFFFVLTFQAKLITVLISNVVFHIWITMKPKLTEGKWAPDSTYVILVKCGQALQTYEMAKSPNY